MDIINIVIIGILAFVILAIGGGLGYWLFLGTNI